MSSLKKSCVGCYFFEQTKAATHGATDHVTGICRFKPPTTHYAFGADSRGYDWNKIKTAWPEVTMLDWCREHTDIETGKAIHE